MEQKAPANRYARAFVMLALTAALLGSNAPSPLYVLYQERWALSSFALTTIFAVQSVGVLAALLILGRVSDRLPDRRWLIVPGLGLVAVGMLTLALAPDLKWLLVGRFLSGLGAGAVTGTANAALVELTISSDERRATVAATVAFTTGAVVGPLLGVVALKLHLAPTVTPFIAVISVVAGAAIGLMAIKWPRTAVAPARRPALSRSKRRPFAALAGVGFAFLLASSALAIAWSTGATFMALGPLLAERLLGVHDRALAAMTPVIHQLVGGISQIISRRLRPRRSLVLGTGLTALALASCTTAAWTGSGIGFTAGVLLAGVGYGSAFVGAATVVNRIAPPDRRATVTSMFYAVGYVVTWTPVGVGTIADALGLQTALLLFSLAIAFLAILVMLKVRHLRLPS